MEDFTFFGLDMIKTLKIVGHFIRFCKVLNSNPPLDTLEKVSPTSSPGRPKPCEGIWEVS